MLIRRLRLALLILPLLISTSAPALAQTRPATTQAATQPTTKPARRLINLRATAAASNEIDLSWYDLAGGIDRYLIERSDGNNQNFHPVANIPGGAADAHYTRNDVNKLNPETRYYYRLVRPEDNQVLSTIADATTPARNLLEAANGQTQFKLTDVFSLGFWRATLFALAAWLAGFLPRLAAGAFIYLLFYLFYRIMRRLAVGSMKRARVDPSIHDLLMSLMKWGMLGFGLVIAGDQIGVHVTALLTGISIMGLAIGFAAQDTLSNLIASIVIFWDKPFKVGDWITLNGQYGRVLRITFRSTRVLTQKGDVIVSSNTAIISTQLVNHSTDPMNWVNVPMTIPDKMPIQRVREALVATCTGDDRLMTDPPPRVVVDSVDPGAVKILLSFCIKEESNTLSLLQEYLEKSKNALDAIK